MRSPQELVEAHDTYLRLIRRRDPDDVLAFVFLLGALDALCWVMGHSEKDCLQGSAYAAVQSLRKKEREGVAL